MKEKREYYMGMFRLIDSNKDDKITHEDLLSFFSRVNDNKNDREKIQKGVEEFFSDYDRTNLGYMGFDSFLRFCENDKISD